MYDEVDPKGDDIGEQPEAPLKGSMPPPGSVKVLDGGVAHSSGSLS